MATTRYVFPGMFPVGAALDGPKYTTIQEAINAANAGDTIIVTAGTYASEPSNTVTVNKKITLQGAKSSHVPDASGRIVTTGEAVIKNTLISASVGGSTIKDLAFVYEINGNINPGLGGLIAIASNSEAVTIENCWLERYTTDAASVTARGIYIYAGANAILKNNRLTGDTISTVFSPKTWSSGIWINSNANPTNFTLEGNTIERCRTGINIDAMGTNGGTLSLNGNTFSECGTYVSIGGSTPPSGSFTFASGAANVFTDPGSYGTTIINCSNVAAGFRLDMTSQKYKLASVAEPSLFGALDLPTLHNIHARTVHQGTNSKNGRVTYKAGNLYVNSVHTLIANALTYAEAGEQINIAAGTYNENVLVNKALTLKGVGATTIVKGAVAGYSMAIRDASNVTIEDLAIQQDPSNNFFLHVYSTPRIENVTLKGLTFSPRSAALPVRGVSLNHAKNVTIDGCDLPMTQNYSLGVASVDGLVVKNSTLRASGWGTVGIFPSEQHPTAAVSGIDLSQGNTFVNANSALGIGAASAGVIQIQPTAAVPITYSLNAGANVRLPAGFVNAYMVDRIDLGASVVHSTLTNDRTIMRAPATIAALNTVGTRALIYGRNIQTDVTLYEDAAYNLTLAAEKATATANKIIDFGAESAIPTSGWSSAYAIRYNDRFQVYDVSSAAIPHSLYGSEVVYLMPNSVSSGKPLLPTNVKSVADSEYAISLALGPGVRALQWYVRDSNDRVFLGEDVPIQGSADVSQLSGSVDITKLAGLNGVSGAAAEVSAEGGIITGLGDTPPPVDKINQVVDVPADGSIQIQVADQNPITIVEPVSVPAQLTVLDPSVTPATVTVPAGSGQVALQVAGPGEFIISFTDVKNPNATFTVSTSEGVSYVIDTNGRIKSTTGPQPEVSVGVSGALSIKLPAPRIAGGAGGGSV